MFFRKTNISRTRYETSLALASCIVAGLLLGGCSKLDELRERYYPQNPRDAYEYGLETSGLSESVMGSAWFQIAASSLSSPVSPDIPYTERGFVDPATPQAAGFEVSLVRGQRFIAQARFLEPDSGRIFLDLFQSMDDMGLGTRRIASADSTQVLQFDATRTGNYILRLQPELLAGGQYELSARTTASIVFPVADRDTGAIQSVFGDPREGGRRSHHGVDIFAPRGTPVVAATDGTISSTRTGGLGGKTVWLRSAGTGANLYYAHLDEQLVQRGQRVVTGDTLGLVGNTGNARTTPPHLHFGIYRNGPVDPYPFIHEPAGRAPSLAVSPDAAGTWMRTRIADSGVYSGPSQRSNRLDLLDQYASVEILAAAASYYRIRLPDGTTGYIRGSQVESESDPLEQYVLAEEKPIQSVPVQASSTMDMKREGAAVQVRSRFGEYLRVTTDSGQTGWLLDL